MSKSPEISYDEFMADVQKILNYKKPLLIEVKLTLKQRQILFDARKRGLSIKHCVELCHKHFNVNISATAFGHFYDQYEESGLPTS